MIVLSAKLSKADGQVSKEELIAVKDKLKIPENEIDQVGKIFNKAKNLNKIINKQNGIDIISSYKRATNILESELKKDKIDFNGLPHNSS